MPNDNDNKLVTLADLGEAYNALYARDVMDASDKTKLDGIEAGAQVNTVTSVNSQTGSVSITLANIGALASTAMLTPSAAFSIPAEGNSVSYSMAGMTENHILTHWNFSNSPENAPPASLTWRTYEGYFTITNNKRTSGQTIKPVFELPTNVSITGI